MRPHPVIALLSVGWMLSLDACGNLRRSGTDAAVIDVVRDSTPTPTTRVGAACADDSNCGGLRCVTHLERDCQGPVRPHRWTWDFPGGFCNPALDLARGDIPGGCPSGSTTLTVYVGCDGIPLRFCTVPCANDAECRASEGYRCNLEARLCYPPALVEAPEDAGVDGG